MKAEVFARGATPPRIAARLAQGFTLLDEITAAAMSAACSTPALRLSAQR